jgi:hypothetical protein
VIGAVQLCAIAGTVVAVGGAAHRWLLRPFIREARKLYRGLIAASRVNDELIAFVGSFTRVLREVIDRLETNETKIAEHTAELARHRPIRRVQ